MALKNINYDFIGKKDFAQLGGLVTTVMGDLHRRGRGEFFAHRGVKDTDVWYQSDLLGAFTDRSDLVGFASLASDPGKFRYLADRLKLTGQEFDDQFGDNFGGLSFMVHPGYRGKGIATELTRGAICYSRLAHDLDKIIAMAEPRNLAGVRVLSKNGFHYKTGFKTPELDRMVFERDL